MHEHKFKHSFQDTLNPFCLYGLDVEANTHFFFYCLLFINQRWPLWAHLMILIVLWQILILWYWLAFFSLVKLFYIYQQVLSYLRAYFCKNQAAADSSKFWFSSLFDIWWWLSKANFKNFGVWKSVMADLQHFEIFNHFSFCLFFSNLRVIYISCREKGHMGFFIISEVVLK